MTKLTQDYLKSILEYDMGSGVFTWKASRSNIEKGSVAGTPSHGYVAIRIDGVKYLAHRLVWLYVFGVFPEITDHKNGNRSDNRIENLREVSPAGNTHNLHRAKSHNRSGMLGVRIDPNCVTRKYQARITVDKKMRNLGYFETPEQAHMAYVKAKREFHAECSI